MKTTGSQQVCMMFVTLKNTVQKPSTYNGTKCVGLQTVEEWKAHEKM